MTDSAHHWQESVSDAIAVGKQLAATPDEFDRACDHIVQLLVDGSALLDAGSHATAAFLAITAVEEVSKVHIGVFRRSTDPVRRSKDPLYNHEQKHRIAVGPTVAMGSRLQAAIGKTRLTELIELARSGGFVHLREASLYISQKPGALAVPSTAVSKRTAIEVLLLAVEAFDDALVGYTSYTFTLSTRTDAIFQRWAGAA